MRSAKPDRTFDFLASCPCLLLYEQVSSAIALLVHCILKSCILHLDSFDSKMDELKSNPKSGGKGVITIACGKQLYFELAATLARSFFVHHSGSELRFSIATDNPALIPADVRELVTVIEIDNPEALGFELKIHLDRYTPFSQCLFIDADCLVAGPLESVFERFYGRHFVAVGCNASEGEWCGDLAARCQLIGTSYLPVFMGALYYFEDSDVAKSVFQNARSHAVRYDSIGITRLRGTLNEEPLISIGMALNGLRAEQDIGDIKCDAMSFIGPYIVDIFRGIAIFRSPRKVGMNSPDIDYDASPVIVHFNDAYSRRWEYQREALRLRLHFKHRIPLLLANAVSKIRHEAAGRIGEFLKNTLRPLYHSIFGVRQVKPNERI